MQARSLKQSLLITAFFVACAAPVYAQTATEAAAPAAPAAAQAEPGLGSISGVVSKVTPSGFTLTHDRGDTPVLINAQTERGEIGALKDGDKVTIIGKVNAEAKAIEARSIARVQSSASVAGAPAAGASAGATTSTSAAPAGAIASEAEPSAQAAAAAAAAKPSTVSEAEPTQSAAAAASAAERDAAPSQVAAAQPSVPMDADVVARLKLSADADLPPQVVSEVSDGKYTTADLNRAALLAMNAAPMPAVRASAPVAAPAAAPDAPADSSATEDRGAPPPVAPEESAPADEDADQAPKDM